MAAIYTDELGQILDVDRSMLRALGWERDEVVGTDFLARLSDGEGRNDAEARWASLVTEDAEFVVEARLRHTNAGEIPVRLTALNLLDDAMFPSIEIAIEVLDGSERDPRLATALPSSVPAITENASHDETSPQTPNDDVDTSLAEPRLADEAGEGVDGEADEAADDKADAEADEGADEGDWEPPAPLLDGESAADVELADRPATGRPGIPELVILGVIMLGALLLRVWNLTEVPAGLHGDEATTGLEALRILDEGGIGVYSPSALGQPSLPFYFSALAVGIFGQTVGALRLVSALVGVATVLLLWWVTRSRIGAKTALLAAAILSVLTFHLHFSRIAFGVIWWPLVGLAAMALVDRAVSGGGQRTWGAAGAACALGVYVYNAHWMFGLAIAVFIVGWAIANRQEFIPHRLRELGLFAGSGLLVLVPLWFYARRSDTTYGNHFGEVSLAGGADWESRSAIGRVGLLISRWLGQWNRTLFSPVPDFSDGSGMLRPVGGLIVILFLVGLVLLFHNHRSAWAWLVTAVLVIVPFGPAYTDNGSGEVRRALVVAPLIALVAAIAAVQGINLFRRRGFYVGLVAATLGLALVGWPATQSYFGTFADNPDQQWTFATELSGPAGAIEEHGGDAFVNFYSARHSINYETVRYLTDEAVGADRSTEFGATPGIERLPDSGTRQLYVLIGAYVANLPALEGLYPNGGTIDDGTSGNIPWVAFLVPG